MGEWISVKDKLPDKDRRYLCVYCNLLDRRGRDIEVFPFYKGQFNSYPWTDVTHWMPLPVLPEEEQPNARL